nr:isoleucine--tRNA ligase, chloroplastic/mitochondrial-like [Tanacetum cinerariifolium]
MTIETHNWASSAHQEFHKIVREEILPIVNQVDARVQNFEIQFLKEAAKFVGDFKSLAKEADSSIAQHKILELDFERLLKAVVSQDIISVVQNASVVVPSDLQTKLERTKEHFENCIIKKETEYAKLWNDWYKKCDECKYDKISYDKAYKDMQQKIERLQAQLGGLKGKCKDTSYVSDTQNQAFQKLENANVELEFQVFNYAKENAHLKATYKNLFDSISVSRDKKIRIGVSRVEGSTCERYWNFTTQVGNLLYHPTLCILWTHKANVSKNETQKEYRPKVSKSKNVGTHKSLATSKPRKPRFLLRWSPTGKLFDHDGKLVASSKFESQIDCSNGDNACTSNAMETKVKWFPNSTSLLGRLSKFVYGASTQVVPST